MKAISFGLKCLVFTLGLIFTFASKSPAQEFSGKDAINKLNKNTRIWTGTVGLRWYNYYIPSLNGLSEESNTELNVEFRHFWFINSNLAWGIQGATQIYMTDFFGNVGLGNFGIGPLLRGYIWSNEHWQFYLQGGGLIGYDLALADALGANRSEGIKYRLQVRLGVSRRISKAIGVYFELGPDREADSGFQFNARAFRFDIGIELYRFN